MAVILLADFFQETFSYDGAGQLLSYRRDQDTNPFGGMTEGGSDYGYRYQIPRRERTVRKAPERFSLAEFGREIVTGFVMGGLASAAFYGAGKAVEAVKSSVGSIGWFSTNGISTLLSFK